MKTDVILYRQMGDFEVQQRTRDGYFDASNLLAQWNGVDNNSARQMKRFLDSPKTKQFIEVLNKEESHKSKMLNGDYQSVKMIKGRTTKLGRTADRVYLHPYLFIDFAMWLNPKFKYSVIKFVYDQLIQHRHKAGDNYRLLTASASIFPNVNYIKIAQGLNWIVFNKHHKDIRNTATEEQMQELHQLEEKLVFAVDMGYIKTFGQLINEMRKIYHSKNNKF